MRLVPNQSVDTVTFRESFDRIVLVLPDPLSEIRRDADMRSAMGFAAKDANTGCFHTKSLDSRFRGNDEASAEPVSAKTRGYDGTSAEPVPSTMRRYDGASAELAPAEAGE